MALKCLLMVLIFGPAAWALSGMSSKALEKMCAQNGGPNAYEKYQEASREYTKCITDAFGLNYIKNNNMYYMSSAFQFPYIILSYNYYGTNYEMFPGYCLKLEKAYECSFNQEGMSCFNEKDQEDIKTKANVIKQATKFICHNHAERIRLFLAEGGSECFQTNAEYIQKCFSKVNDDSKAAYRNAMDIDMNVLPFSDEVCDVYEKLQECIVDNMKSCKSSTPADYVQSLFEEAFKDTPCDYTLSTTEIIVLTAVIVLVLVIVVLIIFSTYLLIKRL